MSGVFAARDIPSSKGIFNEAKMMYHTPYTTIITVRCGLCGRVETKAALCPFLSPNKGVGATLLCGAMHVFLPYYAESHTRGPILSGVYYIDYVSLVSERDGSYLHYTYKILRCLSSLSVSVVVSIFCMSSIHFEHS